MAKRDRSKSFQRHSLQRPPRKVYVIATEGEKTEKIYFELFRAPDHQKNITVTILPTHKGDSSPRSVFNRLCQYARKENLKKNDELWLVIDVPEWPTEHLQEIAQKCQNSGYYLAASYPSFELWLLLHQPTKPKIPHGLKNCLSQLDRLLGHYDKSNYDPKKLIPHVKEAISHAKTLQTDPHELWPNSPGTHVYKLVSKLIE